MKRFMTFAASLVMAIAMLTAPDMLAQSRSSRGSNGSSTRSSQSTSSSTRSSSSSSATRSSGTSTRSSNSGVSRSSEGSSTRSSSAVQQDNRNRSTGSSSTRSSNSGVSRSSEGSSTRSSSAVQQDNRNRSTGSSSTRSSNSGTSTRSSSSTSRSSGSTVSRSESSVRSSGSVSNSSRSSGTVQQDNRNSSNSSVRAGSTAITGGNVRATNADRGGLSSGNANDKPVQQPQEPYRDNSYNYRYDDGFRVDDHHEMYRVAPRQREPMAWDRPGHFWGDQPHYYGYRIHTIPPHWRRITHWGIDYYYYNGIYYRPFGGSYVICRPPFGTPLEMAIDRAILKVIRFAYYCDTYRTYNTVFDNYSVIARQNLIIAQNNARIAAQNANYALNANKALSAYELANMLGLVQSYAYANSEYFYQDGVFYSINASGTFTTIVPPAGALVTSLPDDYEVIVMNGIEYYLVDNTVYRTTVFEGEPFLEVLGQMYGSLYNQYNIYR